MAYYKDLRDYINVLEKNNKLQRIKRDINKDTELHPLVRWQFQGRVPEADRKAFLFENVGDAKGKRYNGQVLVASHAASRQIYALAFKCEVEGIRAKWEQAQFHPIEPKIVPEGVVQEEVHVGGNLLEHGGLEEFPVPIATPGFDNAPYINSGSWITKDPETGISNAAVHRGMVKSRTRVGCCIANPVKHLGIHLQKYRERGMPSMPVAIVIGATPNLFLVSSTRIPYGLSELAVCGGIAGEAMELVKCKTVDIEVPASAEIVIEGEMPTHSLEREGPYGEHTGYVGMGWPNAYLNVTCITHRKKPIWNAIQSIFPPSESSILTIIGLEGACYKFLKRDCGISSVLDVTYHEESGAKQFCVVRLAKTSQAEVWKALKAADAFFPDCGKMIVAVDEDIDARDIDSVLWAMCYRMQPKRDVEFAAGKVPTLDPSTAPLKPWQPQYQGPTTYYSMLMNATMKWDYPPICLPRKDLMENAMKIWKEEGLPPLRPKAPWYGVSLGNWTSENEEEAELALRGEHYQTGEKLARGRLED